jgi:peroxiredoxin/predicted 2-oxoglutarate/Fe(II)-dependent dioxygenase YbiX
MSAPLHSFAALGPGDPAPMFHQRCTSNPRFAFDTVGGRYVVLCFYGTAGDAAGQAMVKTMTDNRALFDDDKACVFGVSVDPKDEADKRVEEMIPGIRHFWDFDGLIGKLYGALPNDLKPQQGSVPMRRFWAVLDPTMRVLAVFNAGEDGKHNKDAINFVKMLPAPGLHAGIELQAPVLFLPNVFPPEFCQHLIGLYEAHGGEESGFMREVDGKTVQLHDARHKKRKDYTIEDNELIQKTRGMIRRRVVPEIQKVHQFKVTRMERYIVSCYAAEDGGHFRAHRDNTTAGTAHRRFAVSINLNNEFEGGRISFPEYGPRDFKPPVGGAVVFSCSLLHAVSPVTKGRRFAFLPFLYDDEAAKVREANNAKLGEGVGAYRA